MNTNDYEQQAKDFLRKTNTTLKIQYVEDVQGFPFDDKDKLMHRAYNCTLRRRNHNNRIECQRYEFPFYGSNADWERNEDPTEYDVLACLECYDPGTIDEFVAEYGYEVHEWADVHRIESIYDAVKSQYEELSKMFSELELEALAEIQ